MGSLSRSHAAQFAASCSKVLSSEIFDIEIAYLLSQKLATRFYQIESYDLVTIFSGRSGSNESYISARAFGIWRIFSL
jgi:hypothetical protein